MGDICSTLRCKEQHVQIEAEAFRQEAARAIGQARPERFLPVVIPHRAGQLVPIEPERRRALDERLTELAALYAGRPARAVRQREPPQPVPAVCASCQGACCYNGGEHVAFIDDETIGRFAAEHTDLTADGITSAYLRHVPDLHFEGSCVFHTDRGCNLPRELRASLCNRFECRGLKRAREQSHGSPTPLFIVARDGNAIVRGEFVDESGVRRGVAR